MKTKPEQGQKKGRGRPKKDDALIHDVKCRFDDVVYNRLETYCTRTGKTKTVIIRELVKAYLNKYEP